MDPLNFFSAIENQVNLDRYVVCNNESWRLENRLERLVRKIFHWIGSRWYESFLERRVDRYMQTLLDRCEVLDPENLKRACNLVAAPSNALKRRIIALQCRLGEESKEMGDQACLKALAVRFKQACFCFRGSEDLSQHNEAQLEEAASVPDFCKLLIDDENYREQFFTWTLIEGNRALPIIWYPGHFKKLSDCLLSKRIGFYEKRAKEAPVLQVGKRSLSLLVEGNRVNLLDSDQIAVDTLKVKDVFSIFAEKMYDVGPSDCSLEMFSGGEILIWNPKTQKRKSESLNLQSHGWWDEVPIIEELSFTEASTRYRTEANGEAAILANTAKLSSPNYTLTGTHSYIELAVPKGRKYRVLTFGKFTWCYPKSIKDYIQVIVKTDRGVICTPDENIFNSDRLHVANITKLSPQKTSQFLNLLALEMQRGRDDKMAFQYLAHNCTEWSQKVAQHVTPEIPNIYQIPFSSFEISGVGGKIFQIIKKWKFGLSITFRLLGSKEGRAYKNFFGESSYISLYNDAPWITQIFFHPTRLLSHHNKLIIHS